MDILKFRNIQIQNNISIKNDDKAIFGPFKDHFHTVYSNNIVQPNECHEWTLKINRFDVSQQELNHDHTLPMDCDSSSNME